MKKIIQSMFLLFICINVNAQKTELTLKDAVMQQYRAFYPQRSVMVKWIPNSKSYASLSADYQTLVKTDINSGNKTNLINTEELAKITGEAPGYINVVSWKNENQFYLQNKNKFYLINLADKSGTFLNEAPAEAENINFHAASKQIAYTVANNLFLVDAKKEIKQITANKEGTVSGQAIARSEFGITNGIFWSPQGDKIGFYQKDESKVADYPLLNINDTPGSLNSIKYPMAGQSSEQGKAGVYNTQNGKTFFIQPTGDKEDYITNFGWNLDGSEVYIAEVNRDQNHTKLIQYNGFSGEMKKIILEEKNDKWTEPESPVYFVNDQDFIWMSEKDGFMNMYLYNAISGKLVKQLTTNQWVITGIEGYDDKGNIYFTGTGEKPTEKHYFKVNIKSGKQTQLTKEGTHSLIFNDDFTYMFDSYSSVTIPNIEKVMSTKGKTKLNVLTAKNPLENIQMGTAEYGTIKAADKKTDLHYRLIKPSNFDSNKKYPVLVYVYGGPHAQLVTNSWYGGASLWMYWMAEQDYLVFTVDNRGSANRGFEFESVIHRNLGDHEMDDQLEGVKFLKSLPYVDGNRLAVHGWSFGGFMTTSLMLRQPGTFTTGVAGGPVTDWKYYEIMYGERYMDRPAQNKEGYEKASLMNYVKNLDGNLLLIHGTADDVVVMQHNLALVKAFIEAEVQMDFFPYPMHPHNVRGKDRVHLMTKVLNYVLEHNK
ncbi:S9 family peptidase [Putridiphycobacter roseus]|uniref:S9 family peptidase n=1 Tax=Putridiphycobacter roseus TaxID=2219161 RepID=A0A2W1NU41_9FLAO|nr:DPP IV N-terminal domain-containing protein [Putridiphycobacter roseus]PZE18278.1 S9 family peptidase [Putridiphycobacter roseus]